MMSHRRSGASGTWQIPLRHALAIGARCSSRWQSASLACNGPPKPLPPTPAVVASTGRGQRDDADRVSDVPRAVGHGHLLETLDRMRLRRHVTLREQTSLPIERSDHAPSRGVHHEAFDGDDIGWDVVGCIRMGNIGDRIDHWYVSGWPIDSRRIEARIEGRIGRSGVVDPYRSRARCHRDLRHEQEDQCAPHAER